MIKECEKENQTHQIMTTDKESPTKITDSKSDDFFIDETNQYLLLDKIADNLELSDIITKNLNSDQIDGFIETIKVLAEKLFNEIKGSIENASGEKHSKKIEFIKALVIIMSILLNTNLVSAKTISKVVKKVQNLYCIYNQDKTHG